VPRLRSPSCTPPAPPLPLRRLPRPKPSPRRTPSSSWGARERRGSFSPGRAPAIPPPATGPPTSTPESPR
jgi:hypothetical protein